MVCGILTNTLQTAGMALRMTGLADRTSVQYQTVTEIICLVGGEEFTQDIFYFFGIFCIMQTESLSNAYAMGIDYNGRFFIDVTDN